MLTFLPDAAGGPRDRAEMAEGPGLGFHVGEEGAIVVAPQALLDQGPEDGLDADGKLERGGRPSRQDPGPIEHGLGEG
jgi:hypothetical protein